MMAVVGEYLNPTSLPSEYPTPDSQRSAHGSHVKGGAGKHDVATMAGMRALRLRCCGVMWVSLGTDRMVVAPILDMVVMARMGSITGWRVMTSSSYLT